MKKNMSMSVILGLFVAVFITFVGISLFIIKMLNKSTPSEEIIIKNKNPYDINTKQNTKNLPDTNISDNTLNENASNINITPQLINEGSMVIPQQIPALPNTSSSLQNPPIQNNPPNSHNLNTNNLITPNNLADNNLNNSQAAIIPPSSMPTQTSMPNNSNFTSNTPTLDNNYKTDKQELIAMQKRISTLENKLNKINSTAKKANIKPHTNVKLVNLHKKQTLAVVGDRAWIDNNGAEQTVTKGDKFEPAQEVKYIDNENNVIIQTSKPN